MDFFGILVLLAIVGGAIWYFKFRKSNDGSTQDAPVSGGSDTNDEGDDDTDAKLKED